MKRNFALLPLLTPTLFSLPLWAAETKVPDPISFESVSQLLLGLLLVVSLTAFSGGWLYASLFPDTRMLGMSGVVFALITLSAFANFRGMAAPFV